MYRLIVASVLLAVILVALTVRRGSPARTKAIRITSRAPLHRGAFVAVVEVDGRRLLVGTGTQQVTLLAELEPNPDPPAAPLGPEQAGVVPTPAFPIGDAPGPATTLIDRVRRATTRVSRDSR